MDLNSTELKQTSKLLFSSGGNTSKNTYIEIESSRKFGEAKENTPLLGGAGCSSSSSTNSRNSSICNDSNGKNGHSILVKLFAIGFLFVGGFAVALYLFSIETRIPNGFVLDLVNREVWSKLPMHPLESILNNAKISNILFMQTGDVECLDPESCMNLIRKMETSEIQFKNSEIPYNFLIGSDGQTYEIRGWDYENGFEFIPKGTSLAIGFIGNYTLKSPSTNQLRSASSLVNETKRKGKLNNSFQIYGVRNLTISRIDGAALYKKISLWPQFNTLLKIL